MLTYKLPIRLHPLKNKKPQLRTKTTNNQALFIFLHTWEVSNWGATATRLAVKFKIEIWNERLILSMELTKGCPRLT